MGDLIQLLMVDHFSIKLALSPNTTISSSRIESIIHFMSECHFELEENAVFPVIESSLPEDRAIHEVVNKALSDHILIRRTAKTLIDSLSNNTSEDVSMKFEGLFKTLVQHDLLEDLKIFPSWFHVDAKKKQESLKEAKAIVEEYGYKYYEKATVMPEYMIKHFLS